MDSIGMHQLEAWSAVLSSVTGITGLIMLCIHFVNAASLPFAMRIRVIAILCVLMLIIVSVQVWALNSNVLLPSINDYLGIISSKGCNILIPVLYGNIILLVFLIILFWVSSLEYLFKFLSKWQFYLFIIIDIMIQIGIFMADLFAIPHNKRGIIVFAVDHIKTKKCVTAYHQQSTNIILIFIIQGFIQFILLLIWYYHKTYENAHNQLHQDDTSNFDQLDRKKNFEKPLIFLAVTSMLSCWICAILMSVNILAVIMLTFNVQIICVVFFFNIKICGFCSDRYVVINDIDSATESTQIQRETEEYIASVMRRFCEVPSRINN